MVRDPQHTSRRGPQHPDGIAVVVKDPGAVRAHSRRVLGPEAIAFRRHVDLAGSPRRAIVCWAHETPPTMGDDLASVIASTQEQLGGLFQKPRLSEKLLSKAPFRFLHDVISAVTASTGFAAGLYSGEELDSGSVKDKGSKIAYLDKIIALVGICSGHDIDVRPSKVVAGLEPEGTNALLTALGKCAKSPDLDFDEAVRRALAGEPP
ncbi:unnamed protein product, partial [Ectocarpus sp. 13 AM-2016]